MCSASVSAQLSLPNTSKLVLSNVIVLVEAALNATAQCNAQLDLEHEDLVKVQGENADLKKKADEAAKDLVKVQDAAAKAQAENVELKKKLAAVPPPAPRPPSAQ